MAINQDLKALCPKNGTDAKYLLWFLLSKAEYIENQGKGATVKGITLDVLRNLDVPNISLAEQRRIAAILDKADAIRRKHEQTLALADDFLRSTFLHMFGDPESNPLGWEKCPLEKCTDPKRPITYGIVQAGPNVEGGIPYIKTGDFTGNTIRVDRLARTSSVIASKYKRSEVRPGDLVFCIRASIGAVSIVPPSLPCANLTQGTALIAPGTGLNNRFLVSMLRTQAVQRWILQNSKGATFKEITLATLRRTPILVPPGHLQERFACAFDTIERLKSSNNTSLRDAELVFQSLSQRAFRGEL